MIFSFVISIKHHSRILMLHYHFIYHCIFIEFLRLFNPLNIRLLQLLPGWVFGIATTHRLATSRRILAEAMRLIELGMAFITFNLHGFFVAMESTWVQSFVFDVVRFLDFFEKLVFAFYLKSSKNVTSWILKTVHGIVYSILISVSYLVYIRIRFTGRIKVFNDS